MTLKEKFQNIDDEGKTWNQIYEQKVQIADENAMEFGNWLNNQVISPRGTHNRLCKGVLFVSELYSIYKKEKGL